MLGPFATASRRYIAIHKVSLLPHASYSYSAGGDVHDDNDDNNNDNAWQRGPLWPPWNGPNYQKASWVYVMAYYRCSGM